MGAGELQPMRRCTQPAAKCTHVQHAPSRPQPAACLRPCNRRHASRCKRLARTVAAEGRGAETRLRRAQRGSAQQPCAAVTRAAEAQTEVQIDIFRWLRNVPWERIGVWLVVVVAALNLKDFFGVRTPCAANACQWTACNLS